MGPASEVEIFHHLGGETVTSIIAEEKQPLPEKTNNDTDTQHRHTVNLQGDKGADRPTAAATTEISRQ